MQGQCIVALYESRDDAEQAYRAICEAGIPEDNVRISGNGMNPSGGATADIGAASTGSVPSTSHRGGLLDWLFGTNVPEEHQRAYNSRISGGHAAVSVYVEDAPSIASTTAIEDMLEQYHPVDLHFGEEQMSTATNSLAQQQGQVGSRDEQVIPLTEEELKVGKRTTEQVRRVRTYVVEQPVQENVTLHDERVVVEKRPSTGASSGEPAEREYEVREHHEEPVVEKRTKADEELVIRKEQSDRTEQVRDTVKKTRADIDGQEK
jgi:stress response protein YsnF